MVQASAGEYYCDNVNTNMCGENSCCGMLHWTN
jgi:hypothetical protein